MESDRVEKTVEIPAPASRVWRALTDYRQFGQWFGVRLQGPFEAGEDARGTLTAPNYEHLAFHAVVQEIEPEQYFAFTWHPYAIDPAIDYSRETPTLVEFRLEPTTPGATRLTVTESGFSDLPDQRRAIACARNEEGWAQQMKNIQTFLHQNP